MARAGRVLISLSIALAVPAAAQTPTPPLADVTSITHQPDVRCKDKDPKTVIVCGRPSERYRIDRSVLEADRERNALPPKPQVMADQGADSGCVGGQGGGCTNGGVIPLIGIALAAVKAVELNAKGDDWRDAIRTHEDEYRLYKEAEERRARERKVRIFPSVGN